jgi:hypothetical protein
VWAAGYLYLDCAREDSNLQPTGSKPATLSIELRARRCLSSVADRGRTRRRLPGAIIVGIRTGSSLAAEHGSVNDTRASSRGTSPT